MHFHSQKGAAHIFLIFLLLVGLIAGVYLVKNPVVFKSRAYDSGEIKFVDTNKQSFKDNSGDYIFEKDIEGNLVLDEDGNPKYLSDLDEIAEAFVAWGKEQGLSFLKE